MTKRDKFLNGVLTFLSTRTVATLNFWKDREWLWQLLTLLNVAVSGYLFAVDCGEEKELCFQVHARWSEIELAYQQLWANLIQMSEADAWKQFQELEVIQRVIAVDCARLRCDDEKLSAKCHRDVVRERGLSV